MANIEQQIIDLVIERLAAIDGTGDYLTTLALDGNDDPNVADSRPNWDQEQGELPAISVFQGKIETVPVDDEANVVFHQMPVMIEGFLEAGTTPAAARNFIADIKRAIRNSPTWINSDDLPTAAWTEETSSTLIYQEGTLEIESVQVEIAIGFFAHKFDSETLLEQ